MGTGLFQIDEPHFITDNSIKSDEKIKRVSFFPYRNVFRKHTRFGKEFMEEIHTIHPDNSSTAKFGKESTFIISTDGDLLSKAYLEIVLPNLTDGGTPLINVPVGENARWVNSIAYALFDSVELQIHGSTIEKHTDLWFDIWNELNDEEHKEYSLVGKSASIVGTTPNADLYDNPTKWYLPLHFFFTRKLSQALPLFLLKDQEIKIKIKVKELAKLINYSAGAGPVSEAAQPTIKLFKEVIYLSKEEKQMITNKFLNKGYEFLIDVLDYTTNVQDKEVTGTNFAVTGNQYTFPIKELVWVFRHKDRLSTTTPAVPPDLDSTNGNNIFSYHGADENSTLDGGIASRDPFTTLDIRISNRSIFQETNRKADHFRTIQPYYHHTRVNSKYIYSHSFADKPLEYQPSGFLYLSTVNNEKIDFYFNDIIATATDYRLSVFAYGYKILRYTKFNEGTNSLQITLNHSGNSNLSDINNRLDKDDENSGEMCGDEETKNSINKPKRKLKLNLKKGRKVSMNANTSANNSNNSNDSNLATNELSANHYLPGFKY